MDEKFTVMLPMYGYLGIDGDYVGYNMADAALFNDAIAKTHGIDINEPHQYVISKFTDEQVDDLLFELPMARLGDHIQLDMSELDSQQL